VDLISISLSSLGLSLGRLTGHQMMTYRLDRDEEQSLRPFGAKQGSLFEGFQREKNYLKSELLD
jgi:hypothetical protein